MSTVNVQLDITGMTCASCATRIERKLNKLAGVEASVNYATEKASVRGVDAAALSLPVALMSMIPVVQFENWQWLALALAAPVAVWSQAECRRRVL